MSVLLTYRILTKDKAWVDGRVYRIEHEGCSKPIDDLPEKNKSELCGYIIPDESVIPESPPYERGRESLLMMDLGTKRLFYETVTRPLTPEEAVEVQSEKQQELIDMFGDLLKKQDEIIHLLSEKY